MTDYRVVDATQLDSDLTTVADAIREKAGTSEPLTFPDGMAEAVVSIPTGGDESDLRFATSISFNNLNLFGKPEINIKLDGLEQGTIFAQSVLNQTVEHITFACSKPFTRGVNLFYASTGNDITLKHITVFVNFGVCTTLQNAFYRLAALETIDGTPIDATSCSNFSNTFNSCTMLKEVRFSPQTIKAAIGFPNSTKLSAATLESIVNGLSPDTSGLTVTLSRYAVNTAFETAAGAADGSTSAAWLALIGTRSNWTVSLV